MTNKLRYFFIIIAMITGLVANAQTTDKVLNVGVMLPLHNVDGDGRRMVEYYRGILMAVDKLKADGMSINVHAWNVPIDADPRPTLLQNGASDCNVIFGPLYTKHVKVIGDFCKAYNIKMVIPFSISGNDVDKNSAIYQVYQSEDEIYSTSIQQIAEHFNNYNIVIIDCNDTTSHKGSFTFALREILTQKNVGYRITNLKSSEEMFAKAFSLTNPNLVILNTGRSPELTQAMNKLDALLQANQNVQVSLFGYTEWLMYAKYNHERFAKYNVYVPTTFYYNEASAATKEFEDKYRRNFGTDMMYALPHFALTGYDHAMYFLGNRRQWIQSPLNFKKQSGGGYRNQSYMLIHYKQNGGIEAINY